MLKTSRSPTFSQQASNQLVKEALPLQEQQEIHNNGTEGSLSSLATHALLPKMPRYQSLAPPESNTGDPKAHKHKEHDKAFPAASHQQARDRRVHEDISPGEHRTSKGKNGDISGSILTSQVAQIPLPVTPPEQRLPPLKSKEHDKAAAAVKKKISAVRALCKKYHEDDIYNMDESLISWKHVLYPALAPESAKHSTQMTLALCVNSTGSDKMPVWIITSEKKPISLDGLDPRAFGAVWQFSETMSMTSRVMQEWLLNFYSHIGSKRSVILILDNTKPHREGIKSTPPPTNIQIQWLPPGTTNHYQPLDQGINHTLKKHYRQIWLKRIFQNMYGGSPMNPSHTTSPELAVHWIAQIWKHQISSKLIQNGFYKSSILQTQPTSNA